MKKQTLMMFLLKQHMKPLMCCAPSTLKMKWAAALYPVLFLVISLQSDLAAADPLLPTCPDPLGMTVASPFTLGTGVTSNEFCAAIMAGATVEQVIELNAQVTALNGKEDASQNTRLEQLAKEVLSTQQLVIQTETLIKDLEENPLQVIVPDANQIIINQKKIDQLAQDISNNSNQIGDNLIKDLKTPNTIGLGQGSKFQLWSDARKKAVGESYDLVTGFIKDASSDDKTIWQAIKNLNAAQGRTQTAKSAGQIAAQQALMLEKMTRLLNQLLGMQATENGAKLQQEMDMEAARAVVAKEGLSTNITFKPDSYKGPGTADSKPF